MQEKLRLTRAVVVEGKYDKIRLEPLIDALIIPTDGFRVFRDKEMCALLKTLAHSCGLAVLTDSDAAGFKIRTYITQVAQGGDVVQVYIPDVFGKERRKTRPGREGKVGVEGIDAATLRRCLTDAGLVGEAPGRDAGITRQDLYDCGLSGGPDSRLLRRELARVLGLPARLSTGALLPVLNRTLTREQFASLVEELLAAQGK